MLKVMVFIFGSILTVGVTTQIAHKKTHANIQFFYSEIFGKQAKLGVAGK
ncbi:hypothetical protein [Bacillus xiapuensis]|nr:hypothetical protein [Bacillus xiapuensis]